MQRKLKSSGIERSLVDADLPEGMLERLRDGAEDELLAMETERGLLLTRPGPDVEEFLEDVATFGGPHGGPLVGTSGVEPSAGLGLGFLDGTLRLDAVKGLDGGRWEWIVSVDPRFRSML